MATTPDTTFVVGETNQQLFASQIYVTPAGGSQDTLANLLVTNGLINGGTIAGALAVGSTGSLVSGTSLTVNGQTYQTSIANNVTADLHFNDFNNFSTYSADSTGGANLALASTLLIAANGHTLTSTSTHSSAIYGVAGMQADGNAASLINFVSGIQGNAGNQGPGTVTNAAAFRAHQDFNSGGGTLTNFYAFYHEVGTGATNEYGFFFNGKSGLGTTAPSYNLDINCAAANLSSTNGLQVSFSGNGSLQVLSTGTRLFPAPNIGAGGFAAINISAGLGTSQNATNATTNFLYLGTSAGTPTGVPSSGVLGRAAMQWDTTAKKLWVYDSASGWVGVTLS